MQKSNQLIRVTTLAAFSVAAATLSAQSRPLTDDQRAEANVCVNQAIKGLQAAATSDEAGKKLNVTLTTEPYHRNGQLSYVGLTFLEPYSAQGAASLEVNVYKRLPPSAPLPDPLRPTEHRVLSGEKFNAQAQALSRKIRACMAASLDPK